MILKRQGYYKEMPHGDDTDQSIFEYIYKNKLLVKKFIVLVCHSDILTIRGNCIWQLYLQESLRTQV